MQWIGSPNYSKGRDGKKISLVVVHHMAGTLAATDAVFQDRNRNTSAHYGVGRGGEIHQYVNEKDTAYHAGDYNVNQRSIGIEHEDLAADNYTEVEYATSAQLIHEICQRYGLSVDSSTIRPHRDFSPTACPGTLDITKLIILAKGTAMLTKEQIIVIYDLAFDTEDSVVPQDIIDAYVGKPLDGLLTQLHQDPTWLAHKASIGQTGTVLAPGNYTVK